MLFLAQRRVGLQVTFDNLVRLTFVRTERERERERESLRNRTTLLSQNLEGFSQCSVDESVRIRSGVNFTKILHAVFTYVSCARSFFVLTS